MKATPTAIPDVLVIEPDVFGDERGFFLESYNKRTFKELTGTDPDFVQDNHSRSARNVLRGLHYQIRQPQGKLVRVTYGEVFDVAVDLRKKSPMFGQWVGKRLSAQNKKQLWIPAGFAHGFVVLSDTAEFLYKTTDYYAPEHERCIRWDDPELAIRWPDGIEPILFRQGCARLIFLGSGSIFMRLLVTGCNGQMGWELMRCLQPLGEVVTADRRQMDLTNLDGIRTTLRDISPDVIVNAAAYTAVDKAEENETVAMLVNGQAPEVLAEEARKTGALLIHYSTDYVFDGKKTGPYTEDDTLDPINTYGRSKLMGEEAIQAVDVDHVILRTSWVYAARGANFLRTIIRLAQEREVLNIVADQTGSPTWARLIAESTAHIIRQSQNDRANTFFQSDLYHLTAAGECSWFNFAQAIVEQARKLPGLSLTLTELSPISTQGYPTPAQRPMNSRLATAKLEKQFGLQMPYWGTALELCMSEYG